jgi:hypothetical protein
LIFLGGLCIPVASAQTGEGHLKNISRVTLEVPPTGTAVYGTKESMTEYLSWLIECADRLITYINQILNLFGLPGIRWGGNSSV